MQVIIKNLLNSSRLHIKDFLPYALWSLAIAAAFFISYLPYENVNNARSLIVSLSYSFSISLWIYTTNFIAHLLVRKRILSSFSLYNEIYAMLSGLLMGILMAQLFQSIVFKRRFFWEQIPSVFLSGSFIGFGIIYYYHYKNEKKNRDELLIINQKLKSSQNQEFITTFSSKIGQETKIISKDDINYFISKDHYTYAVTNESEYIVDHSIKLLSQKLNPKEFIQISRSAIIKKTAVESLKMTNQLNVETHHGTSLVVSRSNVKKLKDFLLDK